MMNDAASAFGLDRVENEYEQVLSRSIEGFVLSGSDIVLLFRKYDFSLLLFCPSSLHLIDCLPSIVRIGL
jgi:hypothetical protein